MIDCAMREFEEETGIVKQQYGVIPNTPLVRFVEKYVGSNKTVYRNSYFVVIVEPTTQLNFEPTLNAHQRNELSNLRWMSFNDAMSAIRNTDTTKHACLEAAKKYVLHIAPIFSNKTLITKVNKKKSSTIHEYDSRTNIISQ